MTPPLPRTTAAAAAPALAAAAVVWGGALLFCVSLGFFAYAYLIRFGRPASGTELVQPVAINAALFTMFALHHSVMARSAARARLRQRVPAWLERTLYTWLSSVLFILVCAWWQPVPGLAYRLSWPWSLAGYATQLAGVILTAWGARAIDVLELAGVRPFLAAWRNVPPRPHVPLKTGGLYALVRHPLYLAWVLMVFGAPAMTGTRAAFACVSTLYLIVAIPLEERGLIETFGQEYRRYQQRVRWRMIPGLY